MGLILLAQLAFPLSLVAALALDRGGGGARTLKLVITLAYLAAVSRVGLWTSLPPWTPALLGVLAVAAGALRRPRPPAPCPSRATRAGRLAGSTLFLVAAIVAGWAGYEALAARRPPPGTPVALAFPLEAGRYRVVNGGSRPTTNSHLMTLDPRVPRYRTWRGQSFGVDIVAEDRLGLRARGWRPADPAAYAIWNRRVLAPCDGVVLATRNDAPDMPPPRPDRSRMTGNHVRLRCGDVEVLLAHFRRGGVLVVPGRRVRTGQALGRVGNSGNTDEPHLHVHVQRPGPVEFPIMADPLPVLLAGRYLVRNDRVVIAP